MNTNNILTNLNIKSKQKTKIEEFDEPLEHPGKIFLAEIHGSAQRLLKIRKLSKYIRFCKCCLLPSETTGVVIPYSCLDNKRDFGLGIFLYFQFIKFCILIAFICACLAAIPTMVFSIRYSNDLTTHCDLYYKEKNNYEKIINDTNNVGNNYFYTNSEYCLKYLTSDNDNNNTLANLEKIISNDWVLIMSADNIKNYYEIFKEKSGNKSDKINNILIDYSFIYFLTGIVLLIINFFFVHYFNMLNDADEFEDITPKDFTILVHDVKKQKIPRKDYLMNLINKISQNYFKLEVHQIISCYNLVKLYKLTKEVFEDRTKIYHAKNLKRQRDLNNKNKTKIKQVQKENKEKDETKPNNTIENSAINIPIKALNRNQSQASILDKSKNIESNINENNINYYSKFLCFKKATSLNKIQERINKNKEKIIEIEKDINQNPNKYNCGTYFIVFKYIKMRDQIYDFFPTTLSSKIYYRLKYFFQNIIFNHCTSEKTKRLNYLKISFQVEHATEAYEVLWKNLGYTTIQKYLYLLLSIFITLVLVGISLCIVLIFNHIQYNLTEKKSKNFWKYLLSFLISIFISITNSLGRLILEKVTSNFETIETRTGYYISLSAKISFFTFINTAIVPLLSNYIREEWGNNELLLNNVLMIFITNITLTPFFFYIGTTLCFKLSRRAKARLDLEGIPWEDSPYTQGELNSIFENPKMNLCYKYSFLINILLTSLFYMSIFPLGIIFGFVALVLSYFLETYYLGYYKRPEVLNARLVKFFIQNFKIVVWIFFLGNYLFFSSIKVHGKFNWSLFNLIFFLVIIFLPYNDININLLGVTEGDAKKGAYEDYELMFPTDYEKQNPLTKKKAMVKYFKKLEKMSLIDKYQSNYLINNTNKESYMDNYYKTTKNIGNLLNCYEFQRQFIKTKRKYKFMKKIRQKQILLDSQDLDYYHTSYNILTENKNIKHNNKLHLKENSVKSNKNINKILTYTNHKKNLMSTIKEEENINSKNSNVDYDISEIFVKEKKPKKQKTSQYMRKTLFQQIKNEGIYDDSEEESEDDSLESDSDNETTNSNIVNNRQKEGFEVSLLSNGLEHLKNKMEINQEGGMENLSEKKSEMSLYSIKTDYKVKDNNDIKINVNNLNNDD